MVKFVITSKAKYKIKQCLKEEHMKIANGKEILKKIKNLKINYSEDNLKILLKHLNFDEHLNFIIKFPMVMST